MINNSFNPGAAFSSHSVGMNSIGTILVGTLLVGGAFVKSDKKELIVYLVGVALLLMATSFIPYSSLIKINGFARLIEVIQFPFRFLSIATLFLSITTSYIMAKLVQKACYLPGRIGVLILCVGAVITCYYSEQAPVISGLTQQSAQQLKRRNVPPTTYQELMHSEEGKIINNHNYNYLIDYETLSGETDYYPQIAFGQSPISNSFAPKVSTIWRHIAFINGNHYKVIAKSFPNKLCYQLKLNRKSRVDLPVIAYSRTQVSDNGHRIHHSISHRGTIMLNLGKGHHRLEVWYAPSKIYYIMLGVTLVTYICLIINVLLGRVSSLKKYRSKRGLS